MSRTTGGNTDFWSATISAIAPPFTVVGWIDPVNVPAADTKIFEIDSGTNNSNSFTLQSKAQTAGPLLAYTWGSGGAAAFATSATMGNGAWAHCVGVWTSASNRAAYYQGANKAVDTGTVTPAGINGIHINGQGGRGFAGQRAMHALFLRALTDIEIAYLALANGHPRVLAVDHFWKMDSSTTESDLIGSYNLTVHGTTAGTTNPDFATFWTAAALAAQAWTQGTPISNIDYTTKFEDVHSAYTVTHKQLGTGTQVTTANGSGSTSRILILTDASSFSAGDYLSDGAGGTRVLVCYKSGNTVLLANPLSWSNTDPIFRYAVTALTFTGLTITANVLSGTPAAGDVGSYSIIPRATCNANSAIFMDGPAYAATVAASGAAPSFSAGPTLTTATSDGYTFGATSTQTATWYAIALLAGSATPTAAQVKAGSPTGFVSRFTQALTAATPGTLTYTALVNPIYDLHQVVDNGSGTSAVSSLLATQKLPPAGSQYVPITIGAITAITRANPVNLTVTAHGFLTGQWIEVFGINGMTELNGAFTTCTVVDANHFTLDGIDSTAYSVYTSGGAASWGQSAYAGASALVVTGDIGIWDSVSTPDNLPVSPSASGAVSLAAGTISQRQNYTVNVYDISAQALLGSAVDYVNNVPPLGPTDATIPPGIFLPANQTLTPTNLLAGIASSPQGDTLTVSVDATPPGVNVSGQNAVGTTGGNAFIHANATVTDSAQESTTYAFNWVVGNVSPPDLMGLTQAQIIDTLAALYLTPTFATQDDATPGGPAAAGAAIGQNPPVGIPVQPNSLINVTLSSGTAAGIPIDPGTTPVASITKSTTLLAEEKLNALNSYQVFESVATVAAGPNDIAGTVYRFFRIPASARIQELQLMNDANPSGSSYKVGLLQMNNGGLITAGSDSILLPAGTSLDIARPYWTNLFTPISVNTAASVANVGKTLWQLLGFSKDPSPPTQDLLYDVCMTAITPGSLGGNIALRVAYLRAPDRGLIAASAVQYAN